MMPVGGWGVKVMFGIVSLVSGIELNNILILPVKKLKIQDLQWLMRLLHSQNIPGISWCVLLLLVVSWEEQNTLAFYQDLRSIVKQML